MSNDRLLPSDLLHASLGARPRFGDRLTVAGEFHAVFRDAAGHVLRDEKFDNLLTTLGKNMLLDGGLSAAAYTATEYMGLINGSGSPAVSATDTMTSHAGWLEAGSTNTPTYSGTRNTCAWSVAAAGVKALSAGLVFTFTGSGTVWGAFIVGSGSAVATLMNTGGTLYSAGGLTTPQPVISTNTLTLSYSSTLT